MGKTSKQTTKEKTKSEKKIDPVLQERGDEIWGLAKQIAGMGYEPNRGLQFAAFTPMQEAAFQGTNSAASAFGMPTSEGTGLPAPETVNGFRGYSTGSLYDDMMSKLPQGYKDAIANMMKAKAEPEPAPKEATSEATPKAIDLSKYPGGAPDQLMAAIWDKFSTGGMRGK